MSAFGVLIDPRKERRSHFGFRKECRQSRVSHLMRSDGCHRKKGKRKRFYCTVCTLQRCQCVPTAALQQTDLKQLSNLLNNRIASHASPTKT